MESYRPLTLYQRKIKDFQYPVPRKISGTQWYKWLLCDCSVQNSQLKCASLTFPDQMMHKHHPPGFWGTVDSAFLKMDPDPSGGLYLSVTRLLAETGRFLTFDDLCVKLNSQCNRNQHNKRNEKNPNSFSSLGLKYISLFGPSSQLPLWPSSGAL